jgi:phosphoribosyl-AMP cyclohydrolase / phosphoribosyl-ATP pyrophosphohydrolase
MLGYMNQEALQMTLKTKEIIFYSRSKNKLWTKGETSGNKLELLTITPDCDHDSLLIQANPLGPTCHKGISSCFGEMEYNDWRFIQALEALIQDRDQVRPKASYTADLLNAGMSRIAQKVGEESVEVVLAAIEKNDHEFCEEVADLLFHLIVLLRARKLNISKIIKVLKTRHR